MGNSCFWTREEIKNRDKMQDMIFKASRIIDIEKRQRALELCEYFCIKHSPECDEYKEIINGYLIDAKLRPRW
jgi:hypothetical protein